MTSVTKTDDLSPLDRARVSSLIAELAKHHQKLVKNLPSKMRVDSTLSAEDIPVLEKRRAELDLLSQKLEESMKKAEKV